MENLKKIKICVLVNGNKDSSMGIRAKGLFENPVNLEAWILYRERNAPAGLFLFFAAVLKFRPDLIYVLNVGYAGAGCAILCRILLGIKFIVDTGDLLYEMAVLTGRGNYISRQYLRICELFVLKMAEYIVVRGSHHAARLKEQGFSKVILVPDGVWPDHSRPLDVSVLRRQMGLAEVFVVGVMGTCHWFEKIDWAYGLDLVEVLSHLQDLPVAGVMIGDGPGLYKVKERARIAGLEERIKFLGYIPYRELPQWICLFDFALSTQNNTPAAQVRTTGKLPEYLGCGRYVLASRVGEAERVLPPAMLVEYRGARDYDYGRRVAKKIRELIKKYNQPPVVFPRGVQIARKHFDYYFLRCRLHALLNDIEVKH